MEKLQKALSKAREARGETLGIGPKPSRPEQVRPAQKSTQSKNVLPISSLWEELAPYEPNPDHLQKHRILTLNAEASSNPFDILRTKVFLLMRENGWTRMAITSPNKACGKTTTACNLATGFSRQRENRFMLFDMDLRRPGVADIMGRKPEHGVKSMLTGDVTPQDQLLCLRGNVALSMNRTSAPDSTQLLLAQKTSDMLDKIQSDFAPDMMIFDLPPMFATDDARAFLKNVDCAMIVARAEQTKMNQLDQCEREVAEQTNVLGVVLNNCRHMSTEDQYYGEYG